MNSTTNNQNQMRHSDEDGSSSADVNAHGSESPGINRRRFLEAAGFTFSLAALHGCSRPDAEVALPLIDQPEGMIPGKTQTYASTCSGCSAGCGLLVGVRDGRPLKMEGMPEHPLSKGGLCAVGQALPLGLYDSHRLQHPLASGKESDWTKVDQQIKTKLKSMTASGGAVRFVTSTVTSPTLKASIDAFLQQFKNGRHITLDSVTSSAISDAHKETHGSPLLPHYLFDQAEVIVSFGADFLGTWISPVEFTAAWRTRRVPTEEHPEMSWHAHCEGQMSLTGSNADRRFRVAPDEYGAVLNHVYVQLTDRAGDSVGRTKERSDAVPAGEVDDATGHAGTALDLVRPTEPSPISDADLSALVDRLWNARGASLVICDSQDVAIQVVVNAINHLLENYSKTLDVARPSLQRQGNDADVLELVADLTAGQVSALFVAGTDLTHNLPGRDDLAKAIGDVELVVSLAERKDDFASLAHFVCPDQHLLETWLDAEPISGVISLSQPLMEPLGKNRSILESLARWSGSDDSAYDILRSSWEKSVMPRAVGKTKAFREFWDQSVHDGFVEVKPEETTVGEFNTDAVSLVPAPKASDYCLTLYSRIGLTDSRHAHNPWLQELPDPITKVTWDNYVCVSQAAAEKLNVSQGDIVTVTIDNNGASIDLPALIQRGQHDRVISIALGYGVKGTDRFANIGPQWFEGKPTVEKGELVGRNAAPLIRISDRNLQFDRSDIALKKTGRHRDLATTQEHHSLEIPKNVAPHGGEVRDIVQLTTLPAFANNPEAGKVEHHFGPEVQLWADDHKKDEHRWGMTIDLNACTGCSACLVACQSENNVPVVGKDEVLRQREMHWLRIDRYYAGDDDDVSVSHQPMMCQHCDNAPCETVCPVLATVHSDEGLNEQIYNRCVGTRYCANNCPYKVRRFNWFEYPHEDSLLNLALNPDVAVRSRGVMEKCSMCVQRIEEGKIDAKRRGEPVADGEIQTACQQSCPAQAIQFGDLNDTASAVHTDQENPRRYGVLEEFNFQQSVSYLRVVKNRDDLEGDDGGAHA